MPVWDAIVVNQPILPITAWDESTGFYSDFSDGLDSFFGTSSGFESVDGDVKSGFYTQKVGVYWGDSQHQSHAAINNEHQYYRNPFGNDPDPLGNYAIENGNLVMKGRRATSDEQDVFAHYKGYHIMPDGSQATIAAYPNQNPAWFPVRENRSGGTNNDLVDVWRFERYPADFISCMFSTLGRKGIAFPRIAARGRCASGGEVNATDKNYQQINAWFAALVWALEYIEYGKDINGESLSGNATHMPSNELGGDILPEADAHENFSENPAVAHQTLHYYEGAGGRRQTPSAIFSTTNQTQNFNTFGCDITPGKIGFWINDVYTYVIDTPPSIANPKPLYVKDTNNPAKPRIGADGLAETVGTRTHPDGSDYYMKWFMLSNLAVNSNLVRGLVYDNIRNPDVNFTHRVAPWQETSQNEIEYIQMYALAVDNPDQNPVAVKGVDTETSGEGSVPDVGVIPTGRIPIASRFIEAQPETTVNRSFTLKAPLPINDDGTTSRPEQFTYQWTAPSGIEIQGADDQYECTMIAVADVTSKTLALPTVDVNRVAAPVDFTVFIRVRSS